MIVWGGSAISGSGGRYDPATDTWASVATLNQPSAQAGHTAIWTGMEMIVWGGTDKVSGSSELLNTGGIYDPATDTWRNTSLAGAPVLTRCHSAVWTGTGTEMIIFGGQVDRTLGCGLSGTNTGARYDPTTDNWVAVSVAPATSSGVRNSAVWTGDQLITWHDRLGARYDPIADSWRGVATEGAPSLRNWYTLVWTGTQMIGWGGNFAAGGLDTGGVYDPESDPTP